MAAISNDWLDALKDEFKKPYYKKLFETVNQEYKTRQIFPPSSDIFNAFHLTPLHNVKVVILGQDPYHNIGQAHGLCFSVKRGVKIPPSLVNIYKELHDELGCYIPDNGYLEKWARQGVLLLNASLTVRDGAANSHRNKGWEIFTNRVVELLNERETPVIFMLWGNNAKEKIKVITNAQHVILTAAHPSPLSASRGFFGCGHFRMANKILEREGRGAIDWQIENTDNGRQN